MSTMHRTLALGIRRGHEPLAGRLIYVREDHAFSFTATNYVELERRRGNAGSTSLEIGTLQIEVGVESRELLYVWGYHPVETWVRRNTAPGLVVEGRVWLREENALKPGVALGIANVGDWATWQDPANGWIRVASDSEDDDETISIADNVAVGCRAGHLHALWLLPAFV